MAFGEPVPGAEIFIEQEPLDDPVASGKTDAQGDYAAELKSGVYSVKVILSSGQTRGLVALGLQAQIKGQSGAVEEKVYPVAFAPGKSDPYVHALSVPKEGTLLLRLRSLGARPALAAHFEAGSAKRELLRRPCEPLVHQLIVSLTELLGVLPRARVEAEPAWPPLMFLHDRIDFEVQVSGGLLTLSVAVVGALIQGKPAIKVGEAAATTIAEVKSLAAGLVKGIGASLEDLNTPPVGLRFALAATKSGFAVGGFSTT
ncbi:MAG: carboxypeptidase regulatory-like domain-containing protein [Nannocystis sp.]|nr:carboxypeptidase regulatory-like domain-containing protein [Nannocystis sp.]